MAGIDELDRDERMLQAFHDGELGRLTRWRFGRRLAHSPDLRRELRMLQAIGDSVREDERAVAPPDLWQGIAGRLAGIDAERVEAEWRGRGSSRQRLLWKPVSALAAAAAAAALAIVLTTRDTAPGGVVHWVDSGDRNVMVLDGKRDVTVIWVFDAPSEGAARGGRRASA